MGYLLGQGQYGAVYVGSADKVYGPEKISLGMFCAGHFEKCPKNNSNENQGILKRHLFYLPI